MSFVFLISSERSGSNLITKIMDSHPDFCGPSPSHLIRTFALNRWRYGDIAVEKNWSTLVKDVADLLNTQLGQWQTEWSATRIYQEVNQRTLTAIVRHIYLTEARANNKSKVFVKENQVYHFMAFLLASFPDARFIYLVRDPRDMALSWKQSANHPGGIKRAAQIWENDQANNLIVYGCLKDLDQIFLLRYENLLCETETQLRSVCDFLRINYIPSMLKFYKNDLTVANAQRLDNWHNLGKPVLTNNFNKYRSHLSEAEIRYIEALCHPEMKYFDYQPDFPMLESASDLEEKITDTEEISLTVSVSAKEEEIRAKRLEVINHIINRQL